MFVPTLVKNHPYLVVFLLTTLAFCFWRGSIPLLIWDDVPGLNVNLFEKEDPLIWGEDGFFGDVLGSAFGKATNKSGYRPFSHTIRDLGLGYFSKGHPLVPWVILIALIYGAAASAFLFVAQRYLKNFWWSSLALILVFLSGPLLSASWVIFAGIQPIVPLLICLSLILYWKILETPQPGAKKKLMSILLALVLFLGPWFREFIALSACLILFSEVFYFRRIRWFGIVSVISLIQITFPTFLSRVLFSADLTSKNLFSYGRLGGRLSELSQLSWEIFPALTYLFPSFLVLLLCASVVSLIKQKNFQLVLRWDFVFLLTWFLASFLPFLLVYTCQVHLLYALCPASILLCLFLKELFTQLGPKAKKVCVVLLLLSIGDQLSVAIGSYRATHAILNGAVEVGKWLQENTPKGSVVLMNALHGEEIRLFSKDHNQFYYTMPAGVGRYELKKDGKTTQVFRVIDTAEKLQDFLTQTDSKVYFLAVEFSYTDHKRAYHSHRFTNKNLVELKDHGVVHTSQARYPFWDPYKHFISRELTTFLSSPDLENDFYRGPAQNGAWFTREVSANYHAYEVKN